MDTGYYITLYNSCSRVSLIALYIGDYTSEQLGKHTAEKIHQCSTQFAAL